MRLRFFIRNDERLTVNGKRKTVAYREEKGMGKKQKQKQAPAKHDTLAIMMLLAAIALGGFNLLFYGVNVFSLGMTILAAILLGYRMLKK